MKNEGFSRQSFLGEAGQAAISRCVIGVVGVGGGGSQIVLQLPHVGFVNYVLYDGDVVDDSNLNRQVTGTEADAAEGVAKVESARRKILTFRATAHIDRGIHLPVAEPSRTLADVRSSLRLRGHLCRAPGTGSLLSALPDSLNRHRHGPPSVKR